jgi:hypothetical protein
MGARRQLNPGEAERVMAILDGVLTAGGCGCAEIGIISPYSGQVRHIIISYHPRIVGKMPPNSCHVRPPPDRKCE